MAPKNCLRCEGEMEVGFIFDHVFGGSTRQGWGRGQPTRSMMRGVVSPTGLDPYPVTSYRCTKCGMLESFVEEAPGPAE